MNKGNGPGDGAPIASRKVGEAGATDCGEAIAIVGMACRFPRADGLSAFWRMLEAGESGVIEGDPGSGIGRFGELFPEGSGRAPACRFGAYLEELEWFDAAFFRISPVEAQFLDPQQRMMLETCWRALEDAGIDPDGLRGSLTGVYAGISNNEYRGLILERTRPDEPAASLYSVTGTSFNTAIGRVAFALGLEGPALALDTACSSSLVAIHQAVTGLQKGEADLALAGGVHAILSGRLLEMRANAGMLSPDGRCATFDAAANGYVRGEGCGIVVLKRLAEAEADGNRIWAVIRGSALNQDGASPGLTVPSGPAQEKVIQAALRNAGLEPADVDYVEAHGTGTEVGDPIEAQATGAAYGRGRDPDRPLLIGSVKTNIGHLEAAAGVAGVIKAVLALRRGVIPRHLHFRDPSPEIDWDRLPLQVTATPTEWPRGSGVPPRAGVSGFGWSGTNAHVVLEGYGKSVGEACGNPDQWAAGSPRSIAVPKSALVAAAEPVARKFAPRRTRFLPLSGRSDDILRKLADRYLTWLDDRDGDNSTELLADMAWTAATGRCHFDCRVGVVFRGADSLRARLQDLREADEIASRPATKKIAFAYTGQASQWPGMGEALYSSEPVVRRVLDRCDAVLAEDRNGSLRDVMFGRAGTAGELDDPRWKQPAIYALECAQAAFWASIGVRPDVVIGHSLGEIAAAHTAGVFSLEEGLHLAATRGELIGALPGEGAMAAVFAPSSKVSAELEKHNADTPGIGLCIAADNGAHQVVSGPVVEIEAILERLDAQGIRVARLRKSPAYHSAMVEPAMDDLETALGGISFASPSITFISGITGCAFEADNAPDAAYWRRQAREPVDFRSCVESLAKIGVDAIIEVGPHAVLGPMATMAWPQTTCAEPPVVLSSLQRPGREEELPAVGSGGGFVEAVAGAYQAGIAVSFHGLFAGEDRRRIAVPDYPFQRERYWVEAPRRRMQGEDHPLLGARHESADGEISFDTELFPSDPGWLDEHQVFGRVIAPGALYGAMAASATRAEGSKAAVVENFQIQSALVFLAEDAGQGMDDAGRRVQVLLDDSGDGESRRVRIFSRGAGKDGWTLHAEGRILSGDSQPSREPPRLDFEGLKSGLSPVDLVAYYRAKAAVGINLGPSFRTLQGLWARVGEAVAEVALPAGLERTALDVHPLVLDGCFQAFGAARNPDLGEENITYLPFAWERLWIADRLPERLYCHVCIRETAAGASGDDGRDDDLPEVHAADLRMYDPDGSLVGELADFTVKRATRAALLTAEEGVEELFYEVVWRDSVLAPGIVPADFLTAPSEVAATAGIFNGYLADEGVDADDRVALLTDLEQLSYAYAFATLDKLGWKRVAGARVDAGKLQETLGIGAEHERLFRRMLEMQTRTGVLDQAGGDFVVTVASGEPLPEGLTDDPDARAAEMAARYAHGTTEIGLFRRSADALGDVLQGRMDPLTLLFSSGEPTAADLYLKAPVARAANRMLADATAALLKATPKGRRLHILEVGAGTGSATAAILPELPEGSYDYSYTDISAGFFSEAESRFGGAEASIDYRVLDIEKDPVEQGFKRHGYDLVVASNVLHATRYLNDTLAHCLELLAPSGQLIALENLRAQGWLDLTFGQLDGWWRFADGYRLHHALATPSVWRRALGDAGFGDIAILGFDESDPNANPDRGVIVARGPEQVIEAPGAWVLAADRGGVAAELARDLAARNQTVVLAGIGACSDKPLVRGAGVGVVEAFVEPARRESWMSLLESVPADLPLVGVVHMAGLDGHGALATAEEMAEDTYNAVSGALALTQALTDADLLLSKGLWFVTRGAQVIERERGGQLAGASLWGFGKVAAREAPQLGPRMLDLDPADDAFLPEFVNEFLHPDSENHIAYRFGRRQGARLVRSAAVTDRLTLPDEPGWELRPDAGGSLDAIEVETVPTRPLGPGEVRAAVEAFGLNFRDVFIAIGLVEDFMGGEFCGKVIDVGEGVTSVAVGDRVVGMTFRNFGSETVTLEDMIVPAPPGFSVSELATVPTAFVSAALSFELSGLNTGDRMLIHAGAGGVGLAAIQLARAAGAEVFVTASARKRGYLRSLGVKHVFDSRTTAFGQDILDATGGAGVDMVLNSLTGEGFIEASLSCLANGGRFVEMGRVDILSEDEMAAVRPDVSYSILKIDVLKEEEPARAGEILRRIMKRLSAGELMPLIHARWPVAETGRAMKCMQGARHIGKIVFTNSPLTRGRLREDRSYLVTGGLGGIGCVVAGWLADRGAGAIVLNGRRAPDPEAEAVIDALGKEGADLRVELADVTNASEVDSMLARIDRDLPPLGGVVHSVGVLSDAAIANQNWDNFETVLWPKILGAWHLHRATADRDLDLFILFSSVAGVLGNPGQANHAAANAFLDQLAAYRRALGLAGQAIAWGAWSEIGEAEEQRERMTRRSASGGLEWITPQQGLEALDRQVREDATAGVVLARDWKAFGESLENRPPLLEDLLADTEGEDAGESSAEDLLSRLNEAPAAMREEILASFLQGEVRAVLRLPDPPASNVGFFDLGMDSLMAVELRNRLNRGLAGTYTASNTVVFDYPDISALSAHLAGELAGVVGEKPQMPQPRPTPAPARAEGRDDGGSPDAIAIVGMACRFPGAPDLEAFWDRLISDVDSVADKRREAAPWSDFIDNLPAAYGAYHKAGFVDGIDLFDARFFGISPIEARLMDPQQRMLLETAWQALEDGGINPDALRGSETGVYVGIASSEYRDLMKNGDYGIGYVSTAASMAVGRLSFLLGLTGPTMPVELNCASSLVAVHQAVSGLRQGEVDLALVGGVSAVLSAPVTREMADLGLLTRDGACRTFDAAADGFVRGEGCGVIVLKRLGEAEADGDRIWAVVRGSAVNQNGASAGATVPSGPAQERVIEQALSRAGIDPSDVDYLEAHGAGSAFGDPIEVGAAASVYGNGRAEDRPLLIGSVKTNIGHLESAAGIAGLIKTALAMVRGTIPRHLNFETPNPMIEWDRLPIQVTAEKTHWPQTPARPPRAGVSAFGISGVNAHVVMEGYCTADGIAPGRASVPRGAARRVTAPLPEAIAGFPDGEVVLSARGVRVLPLSAKSGDALRVLAERYLEWLDERADELSAEGSVSGALLSDMSWTAGVGRSHLAHRACAVFHDAASLRDRLTALAAAEFAPRPPAVAKVAFAYPGEGSRWMHVGKALYETEPVARAVFDRCEAVMFDERSASLLDRMFGRNGQGRGLDDPAWERPASFSLACAITALWSSIGIRPGVAIGYGAGEIPAAQAAGVFGLEDGLRLAASSEDTSRFLQGVKATPPSFSLVSGATGRSINAGDLSDQAYWYRRVHEPTPPERNTDAWSEHEIETIIEIGPKCAHTLSANRAKAPMSITSLRQPDTDEGRALSRLDTGFADAVADAYEMGLPVSFAGLFAGECRCRIELPGYPFQRRRHWLARQGQ